MSAVRYSGLIFLLILLIESQHASSQIVALLGSNDAVITVGRDPNTKCKSSLVECTDCHNSIICRQEDIGLVSIAKVQCRADSSTPYCNSNTGLCSSTPNLGCGPNNFICPRVDGVYPDPSNCSRYHLCASGVAITNVCPRNNVYDHATGQCKLRRRNSDCVTINCANKNGQVVVYPADDRIWGRCINGEALIVDRCKTYERFDTQQQKCVRVCRQTGNQPLDPFECQKYIFCAEVAPSRYESIEQSCACNEGFDLKLNRCDKDAECVKKIQSPCGSNSNTNPSQPSQPSGSNQPSQPSDSNQPSQPSQPSGSNQPAGSNQPSQPSDSNQPSQPSDSNQPSQPSQPSGSNQPSQPSQPSDSNQPSQPSDSNQPSQPSQQSDSRRRKRSALLDRIINNSGNSNTGNDVSNGNDTVSGNIVNGNDNAGNVNSGNVAAAREKPVVSTLIINNAGSGNRNNSVANGNDDVGGNLVNGNGNGANINSGNVHEPIPIIAPRIINNSGNSNANNNVVNGDDSASGNLVNGNGNAANVNSGNVVGSATTRAKRSDGSEYTDEENAEILLTRNMPRCIERILEWIANLFST